MTALQSLAQTNQFEAYIVAGFSAAQIRGDDLAGFDKLGLEPGIGVWYDLSSNMSLGVELLYSERGSRTEIFPNNSEPQLVYKINYATVPLVFTIRDWYFEEDDHSYYKVFAQGGLSFGRLIKASVEDDFGIYPSTDAFTDRFNKNDLSFLVGIGMWFNHKTGASIRYNRSITKLYDKADNPDINAGDLVPFHLSLQLLYKL
jgi:opacity protein-like surface antigen